MTIAELRKIADAATPGPWYPGHGDHPVADAQAVTSATGNICGMHDGRQTYDSLMANRDFIAAFNPLMVGKLLAVAEAAAAFVRADEDWEDLGDDERWNATSSDLRAALTALEEK